MYKYKSCEYTQNTVREFLTIEHSLINERWCDRLTVVVQSGNQLALFLLRHCNADRSQISWFGCETAVRETLTSVQRTEAFRKRP